jgi:hypothetical protein
MKNSIRKTTKTKPARDAGDPLYEELRVVRDQVQEVLGVLTYLARDPELVRRQEDAMETFFVRNKGLARIYLALSADRNMTQVGALLGISKQAVQQAIKRLDTVHMILKLSAGGRGDVWIRNPTLEAVVHLSALLRRWLPDVSVAPTVEEQATSDVEAPSGEPGTEAAGGPPS